MLRLKLYNSVIRSCEQFKGDIEGLNDSDANKTRSRHTLLGVSGVAGDLGLVGVTLPGLRGLKKKQQKNIDKTK